MHASIAVFAEHARSRPDGKLDLTGVYNCRYVADFPFRLDLTLALRFEIDPLDYGETHQIEIHIVDEDGHELVTLRASPLIFDTNHAPGLPLAYDLIIPANVSFQAEGTFLFDVRVNDRSAARIPLRVQRVASRV